MKTSSPKLSTTRAFKGLQKMILEIDLVYKLGPKLSKLQISKLQVQFSTIFSDSSSKPVKKNLTSKIDSKKKPTKKAPKSQKVQ